MPITTSCPHCGKAYKLKDELAGKRVACGNPNCRQSFQVPAGANGAATATTPAAKPQPGPQPTAQATKAPPATKAPGDGVAKPPTKPATNGKTAPPPPPPPSVDAEALAAAALADEPAQAAPEDQRTIALTCPACDHKWDVPWAMQGKNVLCPECRHRMKVPEQKVRKAADWRDGRDGRPSMARQEELEDVTSAGDARHVSGEALRGAGVIGVEYEPRSPWFYVKWVALALLVVGGMGYGVLSLIQGRRDNRQDAYMAEAVKKVSEVAEPPYPPAELPLFKAAVQLAAGEFAAGKPAATDKDLSDAVKHLNAARQELEAAPKSVAREMLVGELALRWVALGGTDEQVGAGTRLRWAPAGSNARGVQLGKSFNVQEEAGRALSLLRQPDKLASMEVRLDATRRVARALAERGQPGLMGGVVGQTFELAEQPDANAEAAAVALRVTGDQAAARAVIGELTPSFRKDAPLPPAVQAVAQALDPPITGLPFVGEPKGDPSPQARQAFVLLYLLQKKDAEALDLAKRGGGRPEYKLQALATVAEWSANPAEAVNAAVEIVSAEAAKKEKGATIPDVFLVRLAREAGRAGAADKGAALAAGTKDDAAKAWIRAEALRHALLVRTDGQMTEESAAELPADPKDYRVGHAWGRMALARYNATVTDPPGTYEGWGSTTIQPFGLAGLALGRQDRDRK